MGEKKGKIIFDLGVVIPYLALHFFNKVDGGRNRYWYKIRGKVIEFAAGKFARIISTLYIYLSFTDY